MRTPRAEPRQAVLLALLVISATAVLLATGGKSAGQLPAPLTSASAWRGLVGSRPRVAPGQRVIVVLKTPSLAQRVAAAGGVASTRQERAWTVTALSAQKLLVSRLALSGVSVQPDYSFARVLNGFSAVLDPSAIPLIERDEDVVGVYPVRIAYPSTTSTDILSRSDFGPGSGYRPDIGIAGVDGRGVTIALLDTGVDPAVPYLRGRILDGIDVIGGNSGALAAAKPDDSSQLERHGTQMAGLLVGAGGPSGLSGVATGAAVLPVRVAGWQPDSLGHWAIYGRSDQIIAGLERAVDPNDDGDAHDAARVALIALAEPFAGFADGPEALAVAGARSLDTLVVAPAGNDGPAGAAYGDISAPGSAPAALTVGAFDARSGVARARVAVRSGLGSIVDATLPLAGATKPPHALDLEVVAPRDAKHGAPPLTHFFTPAGGSIVAGRAALVPAGASPGRAAQLAVEAGASAVLLYGTRTTLPAGGLGLDAAVQVPVVSLSTASAHAVLRRLAAGGRVSVALGPAGDAANEGRGHVAAFSSAGLAFDGSVKPDVVAPGIALLTAGVGGGAVTVNGSSGSAATVAGAAALLAQARPALAADALAGLLVATARAVPGDTVTAQGAGVADAGAAVAGEVAASPPTLALGTSATPGRAMHASFALTNLSTRELRVTLGIRTQDEGAAAVDFTLRPAHVVLARGRSVLVHVDAVMTSQAVGTGAADGAVVGSIEGGGAIRVPWAIAFGTPGELIRSAALSTTVFRPSDRKPALLSVDAGDIRTIAGKLELRPLARLDVGLARADGTPIGLLARLRDVLPGRYTFGLTGRGPSGEPLPPGRYVVTISGFPVDGGSPSRRKLGLSLR